MGELCGVLVGEMPLTQKDWSWERVLNPFLCNVVLCYMSSFGAGEINLNM